MDLAKISIGRNPPWDLHAIIEVPMGGEPVKYEMDKESGALFVDRFLHTAMFYPGNYGFIPHTLSADGDPIDVLVVGQTPLVPGAVCRVRPIGALVMEDESGGDEKLIAVPVDALGPFYSNVHGPDDLPPSLKEQIAPLLRALQRPRKGQVGDDRRVEGRRRRGRAARRSDRAGGQGRLIALSYTAPRS